MPANKAPLAFDFAAPDDLLRALLELSVASVVLYTPVYGPRGEVVDFTFAYLNPAAQRQLGLPAHPVGTTYQQHFAASPANGSLAFHQAAFTSGQVAQFDAIYPVEGAGRRCQVVARRVGEGLLANFAVAATTAAAPAAEDALRLSEAREQQARLTAERERNLLQALLTQAPVAIGLFQGPDLVVAMANEQLCSMWGYPAEQVQHRPLLEAVPELQGQGFVELIVDVARTGEPFVGTEVPAQLRRDGQVTTRFFNFVYQPLYDAAGSLLGVLDIATDVTAQVLDREQVQSLNEELSTINEELQATNNELLLSNNELTKAQQLATERERLAQVIAKIPALIAVLHGTQHTITYANPAFQHFFADVPMLGRAYAAALPKVYTQGHGEWLRSVYTTGKTHVSSERPLLLPTADGGERLVYLDFTYEAYGTPVPEGVFLFAFDVTERVLTRRQHAAHQQLRAVFEQAPVAIAILQGADYQIQVANPFIIDMWGRTAEALLNQPFFDALPELREQEFGRVLNEVWRNGEPYVAQEVEARFWRFGHFETTYVNLSIYPLHDEYGEITGLILVLTDVSTQLYARQREQEFNEELTVMNEELQSANDELGATNLQLTRTNVDLDNFIYTASHDLKAPITNIEGLLLALQSELPAASQSGDVPYIMNLMQESIDRFKRTIEHLTEVSKLQKEHDQRAVPVRLAEIIENVRLDLAPLIRETGAQLCIEVPAFTTLTFSEKNLRSVVYNLLSNALKYHHPDRVPQVRLLSRPQGHHLVLEVQDNGLGLDLTRKHELFTMFQRYHTHVEGSGIGLYMVKKIVENAGGRIEVESQLGHGSTFFVYLPL
jgi:PAS domain S-box-containing protein